MWHAVMGRKGDVPTLLTSQGSVNRSKIAGVRTSCIVYRNWGSFPEGERFRPDTYAFEPPSGKLPGLRHAEF